MKAIRAKTVKDEMPKRHERHLVMRDGFIFTATPCYGTHSPWWIVKTMGDKNCGEVEPVVMLDTDQHMPLNDAVSLYHRDAKAEADAELSQLKHQIEVLTDDLDRCTEQKDARGDKILRLEVEVEAGKKTLSITDCRGFFPYCDCIRCQLKQALVEAEKEIPNG